MHSQLTYVDPMHEDPLRNRKREACEESQRLQLAVAGCQQRKTTILDLGATHKPVFIAKAAKFPKSDTRYLYVGISKKTKCKMSTIMVRQTAIFKGQISFFQNVCKKVNRDERQKAEKSHVAVVVKLDDASPEEPEV